MAEFKLPDVGEGLTEAELVSWKVKQGDAVEINDVICEIETAKSIVELPSPYAGTVTHLLVAVGDVVEVGTPIIVIDDGSAPAAVPAADMEIDLSNPAASGSMEGQSLVGRIKAERAPQRRIRRGSASPTTHAVTVDPGTLQALAKPPVRKLAKDLGVDLRTVAPSGDGGVVTRADVEAAASVGEVAMPATYEDLGRPGVASMVGAREVREPIKGVRKTMAAAMSASAFTSPHVTEWVTVDVSATVRFVEQLKADRAFGAVKVSPLLVLARACLLAMRRTPVINSYWDEAAGEVVLKGYVNLGIAAATPRGLVVPNVKDADALSLLELAAALGELTATAREGRTQPAQMAGGTFTITNVGVFGVDAGTPIINPGESAILAFGAVNRRPWVVGSGADERIEIRDVTTLALSFDHRHIDGAAGSTFLADVAGILEDPARALLF